VSHLFRILARKQNDNLPCERDHERRKREEIQYEKMRNRDNQLRNHEKQRRKREPS
jgi:hypothetical protein